MVQKLDRLARSMEAHGTGNELAPGAVRVWIGVRGSRPGRRHAAGLDETLDVLLLVVRGSAHR